MVLKLKKFLKKNKKYIKLFILLVFVILFLIFTYKLFFYSDTEKSNYGVRLRDIKENEFTRKEQKLVEEKALAISDVSAVKFNIKGRLIKVFINFEETANNDIIKQSFNEILGTISDKVKNYYDISFYAKINKDEKEIYPMIGYKHKTSKEIVYDTL